MTLPEIKWKPMALTQSEHRDYHRQIAEVIKELDFIANCYLLAMSDDYSLSEDEKLAFLRNALQEALKELGIINKKVVMVHESPN
ncbi:hypothetical protein [Fredinandcohnia sp. 179-A 10B2 NHS]|uniref:hypothetical protein n=1 Tax=Fredinandcohnia sp. 179-A 10B2 NHS TaxID=3235176 RepID=UPI00399FBE58